MGALRWSNLIGYSLSFFLMMGLICPIAGALEPPNPGEIEALQRTGQLTPRIDAVRQIGNHVIDGFLLKNAIMRTARKELLRQGKSPAEARELAPEMAPPPGRIGMPTTGNVKILALLIEFQDYTHSNSSADIHSNLFGAGNIGRAPYESLATYYSRASYGMLNLTNGTTLGWYQTGVNRSSVSQTPAGREGLIKQALNYFDAQGHDFKQYDNNGDGIIDYLVVIWTGPDNGWGNFWWGYQTSFQDTAYKLDGVRLGKYSWQWEANPVGSAFSPKVVIHETGHALGLPDYYDYDPSVGPKGGVGGLDMMDANRGDHNCFSKWVLDWLTPKVVGVGSRNETLAASGTSQDCVVIWPGITTNDLFSEFFVVQNRHRVGNDNAPGMPADGMLIWHVDARLNASGQNFQYDNSFTAHKLLRLMEADGLEEIEKGMGANAGDYYKAGKTLGPSTTPSSNKYDGTPSRVEVSNISNPGTQMSATFAISGADLVVESLTHSPANPTTQTQITFTAVVKNIGTSQAGPSTLSLRVGGETVPGRTFAIPSLAPNQTFTVSRQEKLTVAQNYRNTATADINNDVVETNETNNQRTDDYTVVAPVCVDGAKRTVRCQVGGLPGTRTDVCINGNWRLGTCIAKCTTPGAERWARNCRLTSGRLGYQRYVCKKGFWVKTGRCVPNIP